MVAFSKFNSLVNDLSLAQVNLNNIVKFLFMADPVDAGDSVVNTTLTPMQVQSVSNAAEIPAGNGYTLGGMNPGTDYSFSAEVSTLLGTDFTVTASGGNIGPFVAIVAYDTESGTPTTRPVIGYWITGSTTILSGNSLNINFTTDSKILTLS
jgi:hypothetical protein